ncbi:hypothetical protein GWI33_020118 [Rhynchophorus ferrugineus]|uniref:Uncharacterized protein n=1 Tax=Rhynchophorus ferrugineus TaxID=354439 RepID=A0A834HT38_RHYFE|nr:hypothetical protein GWI33_020118 [Rhynchophorus ferrugineus]
MLDMYNHLCYNGKVRLVVVNNELNINHATPLGSKPSGIIPFRHGLYTTTYGTCVSFADCDRTNPHSRFFATTTIDARKLSTAASLQSLRQRLVFSWPQRVFGYSYRYRFRQSRPVFYSPIIELFVVIGQFSLGYRDLLGNSYADTLGIRNYLAHMHQL